MPPPYLWIQQKHSKTLWESRGDQRKCFVLVLVLKVSSQTMTQNETLADRKAMSKERNENTNQNVFFE